MHFSQTTPSFRENVTSIKCELGWSVGIFTRCCISYFPISTIVLCFVMRSNTLNSLTDCEAMKQNYLKAQLTDTSFFYTVSHSVCKIQNVAESWHTSTIYGRPAKQMHGVALVQIYNTGLKCTARYLLKIRDANKSPSLHHRTTLSAVSSRLRHVSTIGKELDASSTCARNMVNFSPLTAEIGLRVRGTPANFNGFCVLQAFLHGTLVVGVSQTLRR